jgi:hypothetical protein
MTTTKEQNDEVIRRLTEQNKIAEFAMIVLGMDERRAEVFKLACGDRFVWDGTLRFKGASGEVPADDPQCTGFFEREYMGPVFGMTKKSEDKVPTLDPDLIAKAKAGHMTARSILFRELHAGKPKGTENETRKKLDQILAGETPKGDDNRNRDAGGKFAPTANNPWSAANWNVTEQGRLVKALGKDKAAGIARAAGSHIGATRPTRAA